jgi:hypothetical protein
VLGFAPLHPTYFGDVSGNQAEILYRGFRCGERAVLWQALGMGVFQGVVIVGCLKAIGLEAIGLEAIF